MEIIAITSRKGGTGKTTTSHNLIVGLANKGKRVLGIDFDSQGNLSYLTNTPPADIMGVLSNNSSIDDIVHNLNIGKYSYSILGYSDNLMTADNVITEIGKEFRLKEALSNSNKKYDYVIIDTPPGMGILTINALTACNNTIITSQADILSLQGISKLKSSIDTIKKYTNPEITIRGILITRYNKQTIAGRTIKNTALTIADQLDCNMYEPIRESTIIKESQIKKIDVITYSKKSNVARDYKYFIEQIYKGE